MSTVEPAGRGRAGPAVPTDGVEGRSTGRGDRRTAVDDAGSAVGARQMPRMAHRAAAPVQCRGLGGALVAGNANVPVSRWRASQGAPRRLFVSASVAATPPGGC